DDAVTDETAIAEITGAVVSLDTLTLTGVDVVVLPEASRATAVSVCAPFEAVDVIHAAVYGAARSSVPRFAPSSWNWTPTTPTLSLAFAEIEIVPATVA